MPDPQNRRFSTAQALACFCLTIAADLVLGASQRNTLAAGSLLNPDSYMRLVRLEDILRQHTPLHAVARDSSGSGTLLHWSHLLDSLLLLLAAPLAPFLDAHAALHAAGLALGPLSVGLLGVALAWAGAPVSYRGWRWTAALCGAMAPAVVGYAIPGVIHHHILAALAAVMCVGWALRAGPQGPTAGWMLGLSAAFGVWLTPEVMPIALLALGAVGLGWLLRPQQPQWGEAWAAAGASLAIATGLALLVDPPADGRLSLEIDRLSFAWFAMALLCAVIGWSLFGLDRLRLTPRRRSLLGATVALVCAGLWLVLCPAVLGGPEGVLNGEHAHAFDGIAEMAPITTLRDAGIYLLPGVFGVVFAASQVRSGRDVSFGWAYAALCITLLLVLGILHRRFATYPDCAGAALVPVAITAINRRFDETRQTLAATCRVLLLASLLLGPVIAYRSFPEPATAAAKPCDLASAIPLLISFPGQVVLADVNDTPEILYRTGLLTVGSLYHHDPAGYLRLRAAWESDPDGPVPPEVKATRASLILVCRNARRTVTGVTHETLWDSLIRETPPAWLRVVGHSGDYTLYQIIG